MKLLPPSRSTRLPLKGRRGERDPTTPVAMAQLIADEIPHSQLEILPGRSHMVPLEAPELTNSLISAFLSSAEQRLTLPHTISTGR